MRLTIISFLKDGMLVVYLGRFDGYVPNKPYGFCYNFILHG